MIVSTVATWVGLEKPLKRKMTMRRLFYLTIGLLAACQTTTEQPVFDTNETAARIIQQRREKDGTFKNGQDSPIRAEDKAAFESLDYFPIDLQYRFRVPLQKYDKTETFKIITSSGKQRDTEKYGYFEFVLDGTKQRLQVYKILDIQSRYPGYLFVPFTDGTTHHESYSGGRYLEFHENDTGLYDLDFNFAYNPSCAYGKEGYNCPIPPAENKLDVAIRAGEKKYALATH